MIGAGLDDVASVTVPSESQAKRVTAPSAGSKDHHETHLSTLQSEARTHPWLSGPHAHARWQGGDQCTPLKGPQAFGGLSFFGLAGKALQRLQSRAQFEAVLKGPILAKTQHFAIHAQLSPVVADLGLNPHQLAVGAMVPKRWAKRAVTRNLLKRQIYALAQHLSSVQSPQVFVVRLRQSFSAAQYRAAASPQLKQLVRAQLLSLYARALETARC